MTQNESSEIRNACQRAGSSEAELQERVTQLLQRRSKLSADEAALLREVVSRLAGAKDALRELVEPFLPASQRGLS